MKNITVDNGLPSNEIYQVLQDRNGNLLLATDRGAVRFDGYSFQNIPFKNTTISNPIYYMYKSRKGDIYFSGLKGYIYYYRQDTLYDYPYNKKTTSLFQHSGVLIANTLAVQGDSLWISFNNDFNYLFKIGSCLVTPDGRVEKLNRPNGIYYDLQSKFYYRELTHEHAVNNIQPVYITWKDGTVLKDSVNLFWKSAYIRRLYYEEVQGYDIFCIGRKLLIYKNKVKVNEHLFPAHVLSFTALNGNQLYFGFENGGAAIYNFSEGNMGSPVQTILKGLTVSGIYQDTQGGIWFSTQESGLFYSYPSRAVIWENESNIISIEKRNDNIYVGYRNGLIQVFRDGKLSDAVRLPSNSDLFLIQLSFNYNDSVIAITNKGYYLRNGNNWTIIHGNDMHLLSVSPNLVYAASPLTAELNTYDGVGGKPLKTTPISKRINSMLYDNEKQLWVGTWDGLFKYGNSGELQPYGDAKTFRDRIISIKQLPDSALVIASLSNGLAVVKHGQTFILDINNGMPAAIINSMSVEGQNIWLGTNKGLVKVICNNGIFSIRHFGIDAGLPTLDIHEFTVTRQHLYLKWLNRIVVIRLDNLNKPQTNIQTVITSVNVNNKKLQNFGNDVFGPNQNFISFDFNCINLSSANSQEYAYMLEGFDKQWNHTKERTVKYTNLPPGDYVFRVQAFQRNTGIRSNAARYYFSISKPFLQGWWYPFVGATVLLIVSFSIFQYRLRVINRRNRLMLDLADSQQKALVQLINPHFLFNILNTVQGSILKQDRITASSIISRFAKLMRLSMELSKRKYVTLEKEIELLNRYFDLESIRSPDKFIYVVETDKSMNPALINIPSMLIQPFVENSIKHGIAHLIGKKGVVHISFAFDNGTLICTIDDNGVGRQQAHEINKNIKGEHVSSGIEITINRLKLLHKEKGTKFFYNVIDKKDADGNPEGTTVILALPYNLHTSDTVRDKNK